MVFETSRSSSADTAKSLAMVNYGLLFAAVFFAGVPALIAVIIAYAQRDNTPPAIRSHHDFQIRIFWVAFSLTLAAGVCFLALLLLGLSSLVEFSQVNGIHGWDTVTLDLSRLTVDGTMIGLIVGGIVLSSLSLIWLVAAPAFGFIRLASERGIGQSA